MPLFKTSRAKSVWAQRRALRNGTPTAPVIVREYRSREAFMKDAQRLHDLGYRVAAQSESRENTQIFGVTLLGGKRRTITVTYERVAA